MAAERTSAQPGRPEVVIDIIQKVLDGDYTIEEAAERILNHVRLNTSRDW